MDIGGEEELDVTVLPHNDVDVTERDRLLLTKQILLSLALLASSAMIGYACYPDNSALVQIFELVKIGLFPLVTLVISFYFTSGTKK
ncbi:hypothetical protein [Duganella radicis]|uniref:Uncharacterized protein n=1 Tax=Duganella radicis TaxID=551988 RepID=A0A6L6PEM7_9BURK|nr:hypothetical protein [Duganella radicis]MTV37363.1 hypothetical protein [Duganella radicis]